jgi:hypothetical protein
MDVDDNAGIQNERVVLEFIASELAPAQKTFFVRWTYACFEKLCRFSSAAPA